MRKWNKTWDLHVGVGVLHAAATHIKSKPFSLWTYGKIEEWRVWRLLQQPGTRARLLILLYFSYSAIRVIVFWDAVNSLKLGVVQTRFLQAWLSCAFPPVSLQLSTAVLSCYLLNCAFPVISEKPEPKVQPSLTRKEKIKSGNNSMLFKPAPNTSPPTLNNKPVYCVCMMNTKWWALSGDSCGRVYVAEQQTPTDTWRQRSIQ